MPGVLPERLGAHERPAHGGGGGWDARFTALLAEDWEKNLREYPTLATFVGDPRYNDRLTDESFEAIARRKQEQRELFERVKGMDRSRLSPAQRLNYELFRRNVESGLEGQRFPEESLQLSQLGGVHDQMAELAQGAPKRKAWVAQASLAP